MSGDSETECMAVMTLGGETHQCELSGGHDLGKVLGRYDHVCEITLRWSGDQYDGDSLLAEWRERAEKAEKERDAAVADAIETHRRIGDLHARLSGMEAEVFIAEWQRDAMLPVVKSAQAWRRWKNFEYRHGEINPHLLTAGREDLELARAVDAYEQATATEGSVP